MWSWHFSSFSLCLHRLTSSKLARANLIIFCKKASCPWQSGCWSPHQFSLLFWARRVATTLPIYPTVSSQKKFLFCLEVFYLFFLGNLQNPKLLQSCEGLSFSTSLNYFCKASDVSHAISFLWIFLDSCKHAHFLSHFISTGISQEFPSLFPCRQHLVWL